MKTLLIKAAVLQLLFVIGLQFAAMSIPAVIQEQTMNMDSLKTRKIKWTSSFKKKAQLPLPSSAKSVSIGVLFDATTALSEQYRMARFLEMNPLNGMGDVKVTLQENTADYHIKGVIENRKSEIKYYQNGKLVRRTYLKYTQCDIAKIFVFIRAGLDNLVNQTPVLEALALKSPKMFNPKDKRRVDNGDFVKSYLPHRYTNTIPYVGTTCKALLNASIPYQTKNVTITMNTFSPAYASILYGGDMENLFFFRSQDVPVKAQSSAQTLIFPLSKRPGSFAWYLACADTNFRRDPEFAKICYNSCILSLNNSLTHPFQRYKIKMHVYGQMNKLEMSLGNLHAARLYQLAENLIAAYLQLQTSNESYNSYVEILRKSEKDLDDIERQARLIREQRIMASINAGINYASAVAVSVNSKDNAISSSFALAGQTLLLASIENSAIMRTALDNYADTKDIKTMDDLVNQNDYSEMLFEAPVILDIINLLSHEGLDKEKKDILEKLALDNNDVRLSQLTKELIEQRTDVQAKKNFMSHFNQQYVVCAIKETRR